MTQLKAVRRLERFRWVLARVVGLLANRGGVGRRAARTLVTRYGAADGHDFYTCLVTCEQCCGRGYDDRPNTDCEPCEGVVVRHYTLSRKRLGKYVMRGKPVEVTGKVWPLERSARQVLLELP
ncbi:hypothetical protein BH24DEI2_BH24DEI2_29170 [soil metagenome]